MTESSQPFPSHASDAASEQPPAALHWLPSARLGVVVAGGAVWLALAAAWSSLLWLVPLWWAGLVAAVWGDVSALRGAEALTARRETHNVMSLGGANRVTIVLRNRSAYRFRCLVRDEPPLDMPNDRPRMSCELGARSECRATYRVTPPRRGDYGFGALNMRVTGGFGLLMRQLRFDLTQRVKVYPSLAGIRAHEVAARKERLADLGVHLSRLRGTGLEFESLRAYVPGDELRRVDWKATARRAEPITRQFDVERSQHIVLCLDLGRTMASDLGAMTKTDHAVNAATLLAYVADKAGDWVGVYAFAQGPTVFVPPGRHQFPRLLDTLYGLQPQGIEADYYESLLAAAHRIRKRSLVVLFTDLLDPDSSARLIRHITLLTERHLVLCAALSDYELHELAARSPGQPRELYERAVATALLTDRRRALDALRQRGAIALDATPANLSVEVLNRYLEIKQRARL
ncbi:MAG TPA: DUF58 domain-containing protein [Armatimonadota bacterium]|nr:DUF58 domain-containing protein [Armatimonadota bacterium]